MSDIKPKISRTAHRKQPAIPPALAFCGVMICMGCGWLGLQVADPLQQAMKLHNDNDVLERKLRKIQIANQDSEKQVLAIGTDHGAMTAARAKGYTLPNERPLHMQKEAVQQTPSPPAAKP